MHELASLDVAEAFLYMYMVPLYVDGMEDFAIPVRKAAYAEVATDNKKISKPLQHVRWQDDRLAGRALFRP
jgi:hypothetical protein